MRRILIHEHFSDGLDAAETAAGSGADADDLDELRREGRSMRACMLDGLATLPDLEVLSGGSFHSMLDVADLCWIVAPESDGLLESLTRSAEQLGKPVLGCASQAVAIGASKRASARRLRDAGLPAARARWFHCGTAAGFDEAEFDEAEFDEAEFNVTGFEAGADRAVVVKPDDGAGSVGVRRWPDALTARRALQRAREDGTWKRESGSARATLTIEPWIEGEPMSVVAWGGDAGLQWLALNRQQIAVEPDALFASAHRLRYVRSEPAVAADVARLRPVIEPMLARIARAVPGLRGPVGLDFIDTMRGPVFVELNPRLTMSCLHVPRESWRYCVGSAVRACLRSASAP